MKLIKIYMIAVLGLIAVNTAHAILVWPTDNPNNNSAVSNCDIHQSTSGSPTVIDEKAQMQEQLCYLKNSVKMQAQAIQSMSQNLANTQSQVKALEQKIAAFKSNESRSAFKWEPVSTAAAALPEHAFAAGQNQGNNIYICQASYANSLYPGELTAQGCIITYGGESMPISQYSILVSKEPGYWGSPAEAGEEPSSLPENAPDISPIPVVVLSSQQSPAAKHGSAQPVIGGSEAGHYIYICRININNTIYVGKVVSGNCNIAIEGKEASWPDYQVLLSSRPSGDSNS